MNAVIPTSVAESELSQRLAAAGLKRIHQGKVRDTYELPGHPDLLLVVATDRLSIFDFVLPCLVPKKGEVLTALTVFWLGLIEICDQHHLRACGYGMDDFLPPTLRGNRDLYACALVVKKLNILPIECVVRGYLTGSGWQAYNKGEPVCGHRLPGGLHDGSKLPRPIFTPTTKAETGHDQAITVDEAIKIHPHLECQSLALYRCAHDIAKSRGIILADTKFEFGVSQDATRGPRITTLVLADEVLTPDSSRFWDKDEWEKADAQQQSPGGYDKEPVRQWGKTVVTPFCATGINRLNPANPEHLAFIARLSVPEMVVWKTVHRYLKIFRRLTGQDLVVFQKMAMSCGDGDEPPEPKDWSDPAQVEAYRQKWEKRFSHIDWGRGTRKAPE